MGITKCVCHRCNHTVEVSRITPPSKKPRRVPNRQYHHCNGENCYDRLTLPSKCDGCANKETHDVPHNDGAIVEPEAGTCKCSRGRGRRQGRRRPFNDNEMVHIHASEPQGAGHEKQPYQDDNFVEMNLPKKELKNRQMQLEIGVKLQEVALEELHIDRGKRELYREEQGMNRKEKLVNEIQVEEGMKKKLVSQIQLKGKRVLHKKELEYDEQALKPKEPVVERPLCYHPFSVQYLPPKAVARKWSEGHKSSASTVTTCLDQGSLNTEPIRPAYTL